MLGGNALFTVVSEKTGKRFTYKILEQKDESFKVMYLNGPDNERNYKQFGKIEMKNCMPEYKCISVHHRDQPHNIAFEYIFLNLAIKYPMPSLKIYHNGRCCRCGRTLTVPESIERGIGPECILKELIYQP